MNATDQDCPPLRTALAELASLVAGQLVNAAERLANCYATPWQAIALASRLDKLRCDVDFLTKDVNKLDPMGPEE